MTYKVTTYIDNEQVNSEEMKIQNVSVYGILNKYIRAKDNEQRKMEENTK